MKRVAFAALLAFFAAFAPTSSAHAQGCGQGNPNCIAPTPPTSPCDVSNRIATTAFVKACGGGGGGGGGGNVPTFPTTPLNVFATYGGCIADWKDNVFECQTPGQGALSYTTFAGMYSALGGTGTGGAKHCYNNVGTMVSFAVNTPAQPCYNGAGQLQGWLTENQRKNYMLQSEAFDNASWTKTGATVTANAGQTDPTGGNGADLIKEDATNGNHWVIQSATKTSGNLVFTHSCFFAPAAGFREALVYADDGQATPSGAWAVFDPVAGALLNGPTAFGPAPFTNLTYSIEQAGTDNTHTDPTTGLPVPANTFWRFGLTETTNTATTIRQACGPSDGSGPSYQGDGSSSLAVWGAQAEQQTIGSVESATSMSSYITTTTAQVTRAIDLYAMTVPTGMQNMPLGATGVASISGGTGYQVGDYVTLNTGVTCWVKPVFTVSAVSGGAPTAMALVEPGQCPAAPTDPLPQLSTSGGGTGASYTVGANWNQEVALISDVLLPPVWNGLLNTFQAVESGDLTQRVAILRGSASSNGVSTTIGGQTVGSAQVSVNTIGLFNGTFGQEFIADTRIQNGNNKYYSSFAANAKSALSGFPTVPLTLWKINAYLGNTTGSGAHGHLIEQFAPAAPPDTTLSTVASFGPVNNPDAFVNPPQGQPGYLTQAMISGVSVVNPFRVEQSGAMIPSDTPLTTGAYHLPMGMNTVNFGDALLAATTTATTSKYSWGVWANKCNAPGGAQSLTTQCPGGYSVTTGGNTYAYLDANPNSFGPGIFDASGKACMTLYSTYAKADAATRTFIQAGLGYTPTSYNAVASGAGLTAVITHNQALADCLATTPTYFTQSCIAPSAKLGAKCAVDIVVLPISRPIDGTIVPDGVNCDCEFGDGRTTAQATSFAQNEYNDIHNAPATPYAPALANSTLTWASGVVTATTASPHNYPVGDTILLTIAGAAPSGYNGTVTATITGASTFTYAVASNPGTETTPGTYAPNPHAPPGGGYRWIIYSNDILATGGRGGFCGNAAQGPTSGCFGQTPNLNTIITAPYVDEMNIFYKSPPDSGHTLTSQIPDALCLFTGAMWPCTLSLPLSFASKIVVEFTLGVWPGGTTPDDASLVNQQIGTYGLGAINIAPIYAQFGGGQNGNGTCRWTNQKICNLLGLTCNTCP